MANYLETIEDICEKLHKELKKANEKLDKNGEINERDAEYLRNLMSAMKSAKTIKAMEESNYSNEYSGVYPYPVYGRSYNDGAMNNGSSNARGRGSQAKRDSMGRYSSEYGYSRDEAVDDVKAAIHKAMPNMPEHLKRSAKEFLNEIETM